MKFNDLRVSHKLWATILGLLLGVLVVAALIFLRTSQSLERTLVSIEKAQEKINLATIWRGRVNTAVTMTIGTAMSSEAPLLKLLDERFKALGAQNAALIAAVKEGATSDADKQALDAIGTARSAVLAELNTTMALKAAGDTQATQAHVLAVFLPVIANYVATFDDFVALQERQRDAAKAQAQDEQHSNVVLGFAGLVLVAGAAVGLTLVLVRTINAPLQQAIQAADAIATGDLTLSLQDTRKDEFGHLLRALSSMVHKLRGVVSEVRGGVGAVSHASREIASGNQDLSERTEQTAANLKETASSMEELTSTVTQSADTARQANQLAATAAQAATRGGEVVAQVVHTMQNISTASHKIADIIGTIDGIAFQTNILALNAAVEAARAGEQGRGFAVVASEVRSLAQRSAQAAKEIKLLIGASVDTVESGTRQVAQAGAAMDEIVSSVRRVSDLMGEISASSSEQRDGINQVNQAVAHLDQMTQQNAALVEESAAAASGLRDQSQNLAHVVSVFNVGTAVQRRALVAM